MSSISLNGDTSGSILIQAPAVAGSGTLTLPTGTATLATQGPVFSAYRTSNQTGVSSNTWTKVQLNVEEYDSANCFDTSTYRFTPNVAGYYQINGCIQADTSSQYNGGAIYKNGSLLVRAWTNNEYATSALISSIVYFNGSTDYIELYGQISTSGTFYSASERGCFMNGCFLRGA